MSDVGCRSVRGRIIATAPLPARLVAGLLRAAHHSGRPRSSFTGRRGRILPVTANPSHPTRHHGAVTTWQRQHSASAVYRLPWHLEDPMPSRAAMLGLRLTVCGSTIAAEDRGGIETLEDPPLADRCAVCQGEYAAGRVG